MSDIKETKTGFSSIADNYVYTEANDDISVDELTVTITLNEYRKLITDQAMMKVEMFDLKKNLMSLKKTLILCSRLLNAVAHS